MSPRYYYLKDGDIVKEGDEWSNYPNINVGWVASSTAIGITYGEYRRRYGVSRDYTVRRKLITTPRGNKLCTK